MWRIEINTYKRKCASSWLFIRLVLKIREDEEFGACSTYGRKRNIWIEL
jgi:hypothetical protein